MMNILFTICGRAGSKGIKNKNVRDFLGAPLPLYTLSAIDLYCKAGSDDYDIVLNTDSDRLIEIFKNNPLRPVEVIERTPKLAGDDVGKLDVIKNCLSIMTERKKKTYDMVIDMDITAPLRRVSDIADLIKEKMENPWDVVFSVTEARRNPYFNMVKKTESGYVRVIESSFLARQQAPEVFDMNASMYAYSVDFLNGGFSNIFEGKCGIIEMYDTGVLDLDRENDFEMMENIAQALYARHSEFSIVRANIYKLT